jgi:uncharacterized protein YqeY
MRARLQADLRAAIKARATPEVAVLRGLITAIDNSGAVPLTPGSASMRSEVERRRLSVEDVQALLRRECEALREAEREFTRLRLSVELKRAEFEATVVDRYLSAPVAD